MNSEKLITVVEPLSIAIAIIASTGLLVRLRAVRGTTLVAPGIWALFSIAMVAAIQIATVFVAEPALDQKLQFIAATTTFCPMMALLGAKRPQDAGWQFIVGSMWIVLLLPVGQAWVFAPSGELSLHGAWRMFLLFLIGVVLFAVTFVVNLTADLVVKGIRGQGNA